MVAMNDYRAEPVAHVLGDTAQAVARMSATAAAAGIRIASACSFEIGFDAPALVPGAALLIELGGGDDAEASQALLDLALREAEQGTRRSVVSAPASSIDLVAARAWHADIVHLCEADEEQRLAAVGDACRRPDARLQDSRREQNFTVLYPVGDAETAPPSPEQARADAARIRRMIRARRLRTHFFRADLFADPAWDMLLDLMAARLEGKKVAVSSLCIAAAVPPTTALRWLGVLTEHGLVERVADPEDGRRVYVQLGEATARALGAWLRQTRTLEVETA